MWCILMNTKGKKLFGAVSWALILNVIAISVYALDYPHTGVNSIACSSCHFVHGPAPEWYTHVPEDIDDTPYNNLCKSCHDDITAPYKRTHSSLTTDNDYGNWTVECRVCHDPHQQKQIRTYGSQSYLYSGQSTAITSNTITRTGAGWTVDQYKGLIVVPNTLQVSYSYKILSNTEDTLTVKGTINLSKVTVGNTFAIIYGKLIKSTTDLSQITITPAKSGSKATKFFRQTETNSFADGNTTYDGVCEVCHTQTNHFKNDGTGSDQLHTNVGGAGGLNCITCHNHKNGFAHEGGSGSGCDSCHGHDAGWQGNNNYGKGTYKSHSTHTENDSDDMKGAFITCGDCHDTNNYPAFKDGATTLSATTVCNDCHSSGGSYDGINDPAIGAKNNWSTGVYNQDLTLMTGKEKWCAGCHDNSSSVIQGVSAPNVIGDENAVTDFGIGYGYYKSGHGLPSSEVYPWTIKTGDPTQRMGAGIGCASCHDSTLSHTDGLTRTYESLPSCPDPLDCWSFSGTSEGYRQGYRLKLVNGEAPLSVPRTGNSTSANEFRLCLSCHDWQRLSSMSGTNFRGEAVGNYWNFHLYHLQESEPYASAWPSDWNYSYQVKAYGDDRFDSRLTCITCHNVHGSTRLAMINDGKLVNREPGLQISYNAADMSNSLNPNACPRAIVPVNNLADSTGFLVNVNNLRNTSGFCIGCHWGCSDGANINEVHYRWPYEKLSPVTCLAGGSAGSNILTVKCSEGVYANDDNTGDLAPVNFFFNNWNFEDHPTPLTMVGVTHTAGSPTATVALSANMTTGDFDTTVLGPASPGSIFDGAGRPIRKEYLSIDSEPPTIGSFPYYPARNPQNGSTDVAWDTNVFFTVVDDVGLDWNTFSIQLTGNKGYSQTYGPNSPEVTKTGPWDGIFGIYYSVTVNPQVDFGNVEVITVSVTIRDLFGNAMTPPGWSFTTRDFIWNLSPANGTYFVSQNTNLSFNMRDSGLDWNTFVITISGNYGYYQQYLYNSPAVTKVGSSVTVDPQVDFGDNDITVILNINDLSGNPMIPPAWWFCTSCGM